MACQDTKAKMSRSLIVLALALVLSSALVHAQIFDRFASSLENIPSFVQHYDKAISFILLFFLFFLLFGTALKKTMPDEMKRQAWSIAFIMAMIAALGIISGTDFTITKFSTVFLFILFVNFVYLMFAIFSKFGMNKWIAFFLALAVAVAITLLMTGIVSEEKISDVFKGGILTAKAKPGEIKGFDESVKAIEEYNAKNSELESRIGLLGAQEAVKKAEITLKESQWNPAFGDINNDAEYKKLKEELSKIQSDKRKAEAEQKRLKERYDKAVEALKALCIKDAVPESSVKREVRQFMSENLPTSWVDSNKKKYTDIAKACTKVETLSTEKKLSLAPNELKNVQRNVKVSNEGVAYYTALGSAKTREEKIEAYLGFLKDSIRPGEESSVFVKEAAEALADILEDEPELQLKLGANYLSIAKSLGKDDAKFKQFADGAVEQLGKVREAYKFEKDEKGVYKSKDDDAWKEATKLLIGVKKLQEKEDEAKELEAELRRFTQVVDSETLKIIWTGPDGKSLGSIKGRPLQTTKGQSGKFIAEGESIKGRKVEWKSSNESVIAVNKDGTFSVKAIGAATITLLIDGGIQEEWKVTATEKKEEEKEEKKEEEPGGIPSYLWIILIAALLVATVLGRNQIKKGYESVREKLGRKKEDGQEGEGTDTDLPSVRRGPEIREFDAFRHIEETAALMTKIGLRLVDIFKSKSLVLKDNEAFKKYLDEIKQQGNESFFMDLDSKPYAAIEHQEDKIKALVKAERETRGLLQELYTFEGRLEKNIPLFKVQLLHDGASQEKVDALMKHLQNTHKDFYDSVHNLLMFTATGERVDLEIEKLLDKEHVGQRVRESWLREVEADFGKVRKFIQAFEKPQLEALIKLMAVRQREIGQIGHLTIGDVRANETREREGPPEQKLDLREPPAQPSSLASKGADDDSTLKEAIAELKRLGKGFKEAGENVRKAGEKKLKK